MYLPRFRRLEVTSYGLYPGRDHGGQIEIDFDHPIVSFVGANGLGKSTMIELLLRLLTGPNDIAETNRDSLGRSNLEPRELPRRLLRFFSERVNDGAVDSSASIEFVLGAHRVTLTRRLRDLQLVTASFEKTGATKRSIEQIDDEVDLQLRLAAVANAATYSDWLLLLRYVTFFQDNRQPLLWDGFAQSQVLRPLYLGLEESNQWVHEEREILKADTYRRNLSAILTRQERTLSVDTQRSKSANDVRARLTEISALLGQVSTAIEAARTRVQDAAAAHSDQRLIRARADEALESARREYEHLKLDSIAAAFPSQSDTAKYIFSQLISDETCIACGTPSSSLKATLEARIADGRCIVCGEPRSDRVELPEIDLAAMAAAAAAVAEASERAAATRTDEQELASELGLSSRDLGEQEQQLASLESEQSLLIKRLPVNEQAFAERLDSLSSMRLDLIAMDAQLQNARAQFQKFVDSQTRTILSKASQLEASFAKYAEQFLLEDCKLSWAPRSERVGQSGQQIDFPQFSLFMTGAGFDSETPRLNPDAVSESQRDFIDLAFRMALIESAVEGGSASIIIDSPEASLDAVFEPRAADLLREFVRDPDQQVILTSNLTTGDFLPSLLLLDDQGRQVTTVLNMLEFAEPTAAVREKEVEYDLAYDRIFERARELESLNGD